MERVLLQRHLQGMFGAAKCSSCTAAFRSRGRDDMVEPAFKDASGPRFLFVLSLKAGGTGLNLTRRPTTSSTTIAGGTPPSRTALPTAPSASARRRESAGPQIPLQPGTLEDRIDEMITCKQQIAGMTVGTGEAWLTELSTVGPA